MRIRSIVAGTAALILMAGCSNGGGTTGTPTNETQPTSTSAGNGGGAPKVSNPLTLTAVEGAPCSAVTADQLTTYGLPGVQGSVNSGAPGPACKWSGALTAAETSTGMVILPAGTSLNTTYAKKSSYALFEELPAIQGYPAVAASAADMRKDGSCDIIVGASDDRAILFTLLSDGKSKYFADPCAGAIEFANLAITTIKAGAK
ncbi:DUF3558 domain-containing protein [Lentzea alba]|uniref:DUF3558 domain-containing protein n=1 Tax=Lentzea alba TaxID=2714351 RepID=UPI0039BED452